MDIPTWIPSSVTVAVAAVTVWDLRRKALRERAFDEAKKETRLVSIETRIALIEHESELRWNAPR